jgi:hypothetical protein
MTPFYIQFQCTVHQTYFKQFLFFNAVPWTAVHMLSVFTFTWAMFVHSVRLTRNAKHLPQAVVDG